MCIPIDQLDWIFNGWVIFILLDFLFSKHWFRLLCNSSSFIPSGGIAKEYNYLPLKSQLECFTTLVISGYTQLFVYLALLLCVVSSLENADSSCLSSVCTCCKAPMKAWIFKFKEALWCWWLASFSIKLSSHFHQSCLSLTSNHNIWVFKVPIIKEEIHTLSLWIQEFRGTMCCSLQLAFYQPNLLTNFASKFVGLICTQN